MQHWTTIKPNRSGYWWAEEPGINPYVGHVCLIPDEHAETFNLYFDVGDDYLPLTSNYFKNFRWGTSPISEPVGEKL